ncbi:LOW QUALITY PROTEIN: poly [ADP-ribose] polymerase tankyrase-like [Tachypleus tridentatus]|uniref:LOW QUALITY PROTEIN: poly [ADP-ribose] polymerase tankyrase-like n=1 Tax=Tachypleus tridentatus TaxID=6853 RepID=UPI003FD19500
MLSRKKRYLKQKNKQGYLERKTAQRSRRIMDQYNGTDVYKDGSNVLIKTNHSVISQKKAEKSDQQLKKFPSSSQQKQASCLSTSAFLPSTVSQLAKRRSTRQSSSLSGQAHSFASSMDRKFQKAAIPTPSVSLSSQLTPTLLTSQCSSTASDVVLTRIMSLNMADLKVNPTKSQAPSSKLHLSNSERKKRKLCPQTSNDSISSLASKRIRLQHQPFQSPPLISQHDTTKSSDDNVLFRKGEFLAVRNENGGFFICRAFQNVCKNTKKFKIQWLNNEKNANVYTPDFFDFTNFECILTNVRMRRMAKNRFFLPSDEKKRTLNILQEALNVEHSTDTPDPSKFKKDGALLLVSDFISTMEEENLTSQKRVATLKTRKPSIRKGRGQPKKSRVGKKSKSIKAAKTGPRERTKTQSRRAFGKKSKTVTGVKTGPRKPAKTQSRDAPGKEEEKNGHKISLPLKQMSKVSKEQLKPNPKINVQEKNPMFESQKPLPFVSSVTYSKLLIRAVRLKDHCLLQMLLSDKEHICSFFFAVFLQFMLQQSKDVCKDALTYAVIQEDHKAIKMILSAEHKNLIPFQEILLSSAETGSYNRTMLGHAVRPISVSRGSREGNDAFLKEPMERNHVEIDENKIKDALSAGVSLDTLNIICCEQHSLHSDVPEKSESLYPNIVVALRHGHHKLAGQLIKECLEQGGHGFNKLHRDVLLNEDEPLDKFRAVSVLKKPHENLKVTPLHCAAVNPNPKFLSSLLSVVPDYNLVDKGGWRPVHYAAACKSTGPLELLLSRGVNAYETQTDGNIPLHVASQTGRHHNVELLFKHAVSSAEDDDFPDPSLEKYGVGGCDRPNKKSYTPLHLAVLHDHLNVVKILLKYCSVNKTTSAAAEKLTPLMIASQQGYLPIVKFLVENGKCLVEIGDKRHRTALTHAIINGHAHVASYLLRIGADPNTKDSSGNTLVHYAAAYGWYFCLKLLVMEAKADPNLPNDWKLTPFAVAFMKGHMGLVDFLLNLPNVDVNVSVDEKDMTLVMHTVCSKVSETQLQRLNFLLVKYKSDCRKKDLFGNNALHHLVLQKTKEMNVTRCSQQDKKVKKTHDQLVKKIAKLLLFHGCDPKEKNETGESAFTLAVKKGCLVLVKEFFDHGCELTLEEDAVGDTLLHSFIQQALVKDVLPLLKTFLNAESGLSSYSPLELLCQMATKYNRNCRTPLLEALWSLKTTKSPQSVERLLHFIKFLLEDLCSDVSALVKENQRGVAVCSALHLAAMCKTGQATELLLAHQPPINVKDAEGRTPLVMAIIADNYEAAEALIKAGADVNIPLNKEEESLTPLLLAARNKNFSKLVPLLVQQKADVTAINPKDGNTALHYIVDIPVSDVEIVKNVLEAGANINAPNTNLRTPLHLSVNSHTGGTDVALDIQDYLLQRGAKTCIPDILGRIPLHYAFVKISRENDFSHSDPIELVDLLTRTMGTCPVDLADNSGQTPLHLAAVRGATISCMHLSQRMKTLDLKDKNGNTPLGLAVLHKHEGCAVMLLQKGAGCILDLIHMRPFQEEEKTWKWNYIKKLPQPSLKHSILQEAVTIDWQGVLYLMLDQLETMGKGLALAVEAALATRHYQLALKLMNRLAFGWNLCNESQTMLHLLAREAEPGYQEELQVKVAKALIDKGVPVMARDEHGCSVITYAALNWNDSLCHFFTDVMGIMEVIRADPDESQRTPFSALFWQLGSEPFPKGIRNWCLNLIRSGASPNIIAYYPIQETPYPGVLCSTKNIIHLQDESCFKLSPLMVAVYKQNYQTVKMLVSNGADVNFPNEELKTPLMLAVRLNDVKMVKLLLNNSYDPDTDYHPLSGSRIEFQKISSVDLTKQDKNGWTVVHHLMCPHPNFTYSDTTLLYLLAKNGAPLNTPDNTGLTPIKLAVRQQAENLLDALQELLKVRTTDQITLHLKPPINVDDGMQWMTPGYSYQTDCKAMLEKLKKETSGISDEKEPKPNVAPLSGLSDSGEVVMDPNQNISFDILMTLVDLSYGSFGLYNFYKMQIIKHKSRDMYVLFTQWGRVGDDGQCQKTPFPSLTEAIQEFQKIFHRKSGNKWDNVKSFTPQPKKYCLVELEKRCRHQKNNIKVNLKTEIPSKLPKSLNKLMEKLTDVSVLEQSSKRSLASDRWLGYLSEKVLQKAESLLQEIRQLIQEKNESSDINNAQECSAEIIQKIIKLSEEYYFTVPVHGFEYEKLRPLYDVNLLRNQMELINSLQHIELAKELLLAAQLRKNEINPKDYIYCCLGSKLQLLEEDSVEAQFILQYIHNTENDRRRANIQAIYQVQQKDSSDFFQKNTRKHMLLWHGTSAGNVLSILTRGLRVAPLGVRLTGSMFGKGIYFADMFQKSESYCYPGNKQTKFMFLCEVSLGKVHQIKCLPHILFLTSKHCYDTLHALGTWHPNRAHSVSWQDDLYASGSVTQRHRFMVFLRCARCSGKDYDAFECEIDAHCVNCNGSHPSFIHALGREITLGPREADVDIHKNIIHRSLQFNEYVVFEPSHVCIRYLVQFKT